jgi:hypothetical protein
VKGFVAAWLAGMGIVIWREVHASSHMPVPANLVGVTGLFAALALIGDAVPGAQTPVTLLAWGLDIAGFLNVLPAGLFGQIQTTAATENTATSGTAASISNPAAPGTNAPAGGGITAV